MQKNTFNIEDRTNDTLYDDDGKPRRTGTFWTASAHIITAVIGSGVLSLAWCLAQLGWVAGLISLAVFSVITLYTAILFADCYRFPDPVTGNRIYSYRDVVKIHLGEFKCKLCATCQYANLVGVGIGYTVTSAISMAAVDRSNCFHKHGHDAGCHVYTSKYIFIFAAIQVVLSQYPNFHELTALSILAAVMSFAYSLIGIFLSIAKIAGGNRVTTTLFGSVVGVDVTISQKIWNVLTSLGNIATAYSFSQIIIEIQDTLKSSPPENKVMKKANVVGISVTAIFYIMCATLGYAAFGNKAPGNFLTGFGFYEPFWLVNIGNICVVIHLIGAYQVFSQPVYALVETWCRKRWPNSDFVTAQYSFSIPILGACNFNIFRLVWRTIYVIVTAILAMIFPFFNAIMGLLGALSFFPLTIYFPIEIHLSRAQIPRFSMSWVLHKLVVWFCFIMALVSAIASIQQIIKEVGHFKPFHFVT